MSTGAIALAIFHADFTMHGAVRRIQKIGIDRTTDKEFSLNMDGPRTWKIFSLIRTPLVCCEE